MSINCSSILKDIIAIIIIYIITKVMDDYIDKEENIILFDISKNGFLSYILILYSFSCLLNHELSTGLFMSAYIIGMFSDLNRKLSFKLKGYQETIIVFFIGIILMGLVSFITYFIIILALDLLDDIIDEKIDKKLKNKNLSIRYGKIEVLLSAIILLLICIKLEPIKLLLCLLVFIVFQSVEKMHLGRMVQND